MTTPHADPYPPPGADVPGAPPPLLRDRTTAPTPPTPTAPPTPMAQPQRPRRLAERRGTLAVAALTAAAVALAVVVRRRRRQPATRHP